MTATHKCTVCGEAETETIETTSVITEDPTCKTEGVRQYSAVFANDAFEPQTETEAIAINPEAHKWGDWTEELDETGHYNKRECEYGCGTVQRIDIAAEDCDHADKEEIAEIPPTYTSESYKSYMKCNKCGKYIVVIDGHETVVTVENVDELIEALKIPALGGSSGGSTEPAEPTTEIDSTIPVKAVITDNTAVVSEITA